MKIREDISHSTLWQPENTLIQERKEGPEATPPVPFPRQFPHITPLLPSTLPTVLILNFRAPCLTKKFCLNFQGPEVVEGSVWHENMLWDQTPLRKQDRNGVSVPGACLFPIQLSKGKQKSDLYKYRVPPIGPVYSQTPTGHILNPRTPPGHDP